jgi:alpha- and gamma-adaptin-binding protein p34
MEIQNPRRVLAVSLSESSNLLSRTIKGMAPLSSVTKGEPILTRIGTELTGAYPEPAPSEDSEPTIAGVTHILDIKTQYYSTAVPIWLDLIADPAEWAAAFLSPEAAEVLAALGGLVLVFELPTAPPDASEAAAARDLLARAGALLETRQLGWAWDGVALAVGICSRAVDDADRDAWDAVCGEHSMEFVLVAPGQPARNEFGEVTGMARVREALEATEWSQGSAGALEGLDEADKDDENDEDEDEDGDEFGKFQNGERDEGGDLDPGSLSFGFDRADFEGLKKAILSAGRESGDGEDKPDEELGDGDVQQLETMMRKLQAVRDMSAGLPEEQRKKLAAQAVGEVMKEF